MRKGRPNDPQRRARIVSAALDVITTDGVHAASHRRIAARADVPLGSMTYYFSDLDTLIVDAFQTLREGLGPRYAAPLRTAETEADVVEALVSATCGATAPTRDDIRLYEEMRHYGTRSPRVAALLRDLQEESLAILRRSLSDGAARAVDALMWGWWSYLVLHDDPLDEAVVRRAYLALVAVEPPRRARREPTGRA